MSVFISTACNAENVGAECGTVLGFYFERVWRKCDFMIGNLTFGGSRAVKDLGAHSAEWRASAHPCRTFLSRALVFHLDENASHILGLME